MTTKVKVPDEVRQAMGAEPTEEQWEAISMPLEPYVIVAGAGSGKTSVMAARVVYLALVALGRVQADHPGVLPGNVLCLTFTNKATENLVLRIRAALSALELPEGEEPTIVNYHSFAAQVLERHGLLAGIEPGQRVLTSAQRTEVCAGLLDEISFEHVHAEWQPTLIGNILNLADQAANHRVAPERIVEYVTGQLEDLRAYRSGEPYQAALERIELAGAVRAFQDRKRSMGVIDFGDQITLALDLVERFPEVRMAYRERYQTVVLDEYQDTNVAQADLLRRIFDGGFPVTAVGDPDQNIYAWRGASLFNLIQFQHHFARADGSSPRRLPLYTNFRSGSRILEAADTVITPLPPEQRPDPEKKLVAWERNGEGEVELVGHSDEWSEATWIAHRIEELHAADPLDNPWSSFAVLSRKKRLFTPLQQAFSELGIPAEFVGLAGLVKLPEVVEVLAYARAVADPNAGVSLARILLGPRYRVGFKDLARVAAWAKDRNYGIRGEDEEDTAPFLFAEALEHLDEAGPISEEGRRRLEEFRDELASLREEARRPVGEFLAEVIRRTGLLAELEASTDIERATATRRNLSSFLDEVHAFAPLQGEMTLRAFLDYLDVVEESDTPEWSPVQPSQDDSVKVMTIHQAKGLEFDTVFVPGLAHSILPDPKVQQNPAERGYSLDFELRGDAEILPTLDQFGGVMKKFYFGLKDRAIIEERRTCYVALTRARRRLFVSGAHWYGDEVQKAKERSIFLDELFTWGEESGRARVERGPEPGDVNPLLGYRERFVRDWPGPALPSDDDALFPQGWRAAAAASAAAAAKPVAAVSPEDAGAFEEEAGQLRLLATHLAEREREAPARPALPATISVGGVIDYARCPKRFYWGVVRPLPRFSGPAARIGTQVHAWIERQAAGQATLLELEQAPDLTVEELAGEPGKLERLQRNFQESRFAGVTPLYAERPFLLHLDGFVVAGRIDAIYGLPDGPWEVVDYKTGRKPSQEDSLAWLQLDLYALACTEVWRKRSEDLTLSYFYLRTGEVDSRPARDVEGVRKRVLDSLGRMAEERFEPTPGEQCRWCDFLPFCDAGRAYVELTSASEAR